jgi:acyl carrier protein
MSDTVKNSIRTFVVDDVLEGQDFHDLTDSTPLITTAVLDSIAVLKIVLFLEEEFSIGVDPAQIDADHLDTVDLMAELVQSTRESQES